MFWCKNGDMRLTEWVLMPYKSARADDFSKDWIAFAIFTDQGYTFRCKNDPADDAVVFYPTLKAAQEAAEKAALFIRLTK